VRTIIFLKCFLVFDLILYFYFILGYTWAVRTRTRGDAAHRLLVDTGLPPGLAARGRGSDAAHQLATDPGSRLGHGKYVVKFWKNEIISRYTVPRADPGVAAPV
jgi:hypothetical protein